MCIRDRYIVESTGAYKTYDRCKLHLDCLLYTSKRRKLLRQIGERLDILKDLLPKSDGEPEATYQNFIISLCQELQTMRDNAAASRADSLHYYTVWVLSLIHI